MQEIDLSPAQRGYYTLQELEENHVLPPKSIINGRRVAVIECIENIPCNPCSKACKFGAVWKEHFCKPGIVDWDKCTGCTQCVAACPGMAVFCMMILNNKGYVTVPYEFLPRPKLGLRAQLFNRTGEIVGEGIVVQPTYEARGNSIARWVVTVEIENPELVYQVRAIKLLEEDK